MSTNIMTASNQWANRPADERYWNLEEMASATLAYRQASAQTLPVPLSRLRIAPPQTDGPQEPVLIGPTGSAATFTHTGFGQLCSIVGAPASYLRTLPAGLAASALAYSQKQVDSDRSCVMLLHKNGGLAVRAITSEKYSRIWNADITRWLLGNLPSGFRTPPARPSGVANERTRIATSDDVLEGRTMGLSIREGMTIAPAGCYASDHDMFVFMVDQTRPIEVPGSQSPLYRGFFVRNNEVGTGSLVITMFLYDTVCGNHIVWNAQQIKEVRIRHMGQAAYREFGSARHAMIDSVHNASGNRDIEAIMSARKFLLGDSKDEVVERLYVKDLAPRRTLEAAYTIAEEHSESHGDPRSAWGMMSGFTRLSQESGYSDDRDRLDRIGAKVLTMAF